MNKKIRAIIVLTFLIITSFSILIPTVDAASPASYVTITLTNSQTTPTPKDFQQLLKIDWNTYASDLNANVSNVRFFNSTSFSSSNELSGWIETNNTTSATSSNVWVNLSGTIIPASGSTTIYMAFLPTTASWSSHWGLAPQLSTVYGAFDNGANVFLFYNDFKGTTLSSKWQAIPTGSGATYTVDNGITLYGPSGGNNALHLVTKNEYNPAILEAYVTTDTVNPNGNGIAYDTVLPTTTGGDIGFQDVYRFDYISPAARIILDSGGSGSLVNRVDTSISLPVLIGGLWPSTGNEIQTWNYVNIVSGTDSTLSHTNSYLEIYAAGVSSSSATLSADYVRLRAYPPDGVMPSVTFGSLTKVIIPSGRQISFQQTSLPSGTKWGIRLNNTTAIMWQNTTGEYDNLTGLDAGSYTFQVVNATGYASNPYTDLLTIVSTNLTQSITFTGYSATFTESGLPAGDTWYVNLSNQPGLSESSTGQKLSGTSVSLSTHEPNGTYAFSYQTSDKRYQGGTGTFTVNGASITEDVTFSAVLYYLNFTDINKPKAVEWGVNVSGAIKTGYGNISFQLVNGTYYWNASAINTSFNHPLGWWRLTNGSGTVLLHNESSFPGMKVVINGKNYNDNVTFARAYNVSFEEVGIGDTFQWDVNLSNGLGVTLDKHIIVSNNVTQVFFNSTEGNYTNSSYTGTIQVLVYGTTGVRYINFTSSSITESISGGNIVLVYNFITQYFLTTHSVPSSGGYHSPYSQWVNSSATVQLTARGNSSFEFTGFQGSNTSSYTGMGYYSSGEYIVSITMTNPITETMDFSNYIVLTFYMQNLTTGQEWGIKLSDSSGLVQWNNGTGYYIVFDIPQGTYSYLVTGVKATPQSNQVSISESTEILLQYDVSTYDANFQEIGLQPGTSWNMQVFSDALSLSSTGTSSILNFEVPNGTYSYFAASVYGYISNNSTGSFTIHGSSLLIYVNWTQGNALILQQIRHFVPITINTTNFSIPAGAQVPLNVNWSRYAVYENHNLSNVLFMNSTFYPLFSWIESGANSSSRSSEVWVKITASVSSFSSTIVYLVWQNSNRNNFNKYGYLGEAPQLSPVYGEYNNIAEVMDPGLLEQFYTNSSIFYQAGLSSYSLYNSTSLLQGSYVSVGSDRYYAGQNYFITQPSGSTQEVYQDTGPSSYAPYALENNVLISYQTVVGSYPGTWPSPPLIYTSYAQTWFAKVMGFVQMNNPNTQWYSLEDDGSYLSVGNSNSYLTSGWASQHDILTTTGSAAATPLLSGASPIQGTAQFIMQYEEVDSGQAIWQFWSNFPVTYWHPVPIQGFNESSQVSFGSVVSSYNSFYEYGLPVGTNWSIAISGPGFSKLYTTNSNLIYTYLPNGTYLYTVGSMVNGSYHSGIDGKFIPSPQSGHVIVTGAFTVQYIIFTKNDLLEYDLIPGQAQYNNGSIILPIFVLNQNNQPANASVITSIWKNMSLTYIARLQNQTRIIPFTFSNSGLGMFAIFFSLKVVEVKNIKTSNATLSMISDFQKTAFYTGIATGIAGSASFVNVIVKGQNITNQPVQGISPTNNTTVPWYVGLIADYYPAYSSNPLIEIENILIWILDNSGGRALTLLVGLATLAYFAWMINKNRKDKGDKKWKYRMEKKLDSLYRKITGVS